MRLRNLTWGWDSPALRWPHPHSRRKPQPLRRSSRRGSGGRIGAAEAAADPVPDKGDTAWMMVATVLVMLMIVPGLALFYGGLVRTKNMASVLTQILAVASLAMMMWVMFGYGLWPSVGTPTSSSRPANSSSPA
jgi:hypothetical protein